MFFIGMTQNINNEKRTPKIEITNKMPSKTFAIADINRYTESESIRFIRESLGYEIITKPTLFTK